MTAPMVRIVLPTPLRQLARVHGELRLGVAEPVTQRTILDAVEASYPMLRGTLRDHVTHRRRDFVRFYACEEDWSNASPDDALPEEVAQGKEPFLVVGALSGG
jgi:molybdopterin synthase sulfur carrier subunit